MGADAATDRPRRRPGAAPASRGATSRPSSRRCFGPRSPRSRYPDARPRRRARPSTPTWRPTSRAASADGHQASGDPQAGGCQVDDSEVGRPSLGRPASRRPRRPRRPRWLRRPRPPLPRPARRARPPRQRHRRPTSAMARPPRPPSDGVHGRRQPRPSPPDRPIMERARTRGQPAAVRAVATMIGGRGAARRPARRPGRGRQDDARARPRGGSAVHRPHRRSAVPGVPGLSDGRRRWPPGPPPAGAGRAWPPGGDRRTRRPLPWRARPRHRAVAHARRGRCPGGDHRGGRADERGRPGGPPQDARGTAAGRDHRAVRRPGGPPPADGPLALLPDPSRARRGTRHRGHRRGPWPGGSTDRGPPRAPGRWPTRARARLRPGARGRPDQGRARARRPRPDRHAALGATRRRARGPPARPRASRRPQPARSGRRAGPSGTTAWRGRGPGRERAG